jgi:hypothetical protein
MLLTGLWFHPVKIIPALFHIYWPTDRRMNDWQYSSHSFLRVCWLWAGIESTEIASSNPWSEDEYITKLFCVLLLCQMSMNSLFQNYKRTEYGSHNINRVYEGSRIIFSLY